MNNAQIIRRATWVGLLLNLFLSFLKIALGTIAMSHAVVADGVHSLSDLLTDAAILIGLRYWSAPADDDHPHGHGRIETLIAVAIGLLLAGIAVAIAVQGISAIQETGQQQPGWLALAATLVSLIVKELLYRWTLNQSRRARSIALRANAWHHRSDALSSLPAAIAVAVALVEPSLAFVDSIGAVVVAGFIMFAAWKIVVPSLSQLIDRGAPRHEREAIVAIAMATPGVRHAHAVRTRYIGDGLQVDLHVEVDADITVRAGHDIAEAVHLSLLDQGPAVRDVIVHIEPHDPPDGAPT